MIERKARKSLWLLALTLIVVACTANIEPSTLAEIIQTESLELIDSQSASAEEDVSEIAEDALVTTETNLSSHSPLATPPPAPQMPDGDFRSWVQVADGFRQPLFLSHAGDGSNRLFVLGQQGRIWVIENGVVLAEAFLDIRGRVNSQSNEQGLLGLAFHTDFENNGFFYVNYTDDTPATIISRFFIVADSKFADPNSEKILLSIKQPYSNHNGGHIEFGPDGYLYIGMGDGGSAGDPQNNAQSSDTLLGAILRIDVDGGDLYAIPPDNPFVNGGGRPEIWLTGLRNPWRFSFDSATGDLFIGDVGQNTWEEIDYLSGESSGGGNFGWNYYEGNHLYEGPAPANLSLIAPIAEYDHGNSRCSITGGLVYRGRQMPELRGVYFYGDFCSGEIFALVRDDDGQWRSEVVYNLALLITSFGSDESGEIYVLDRNGGLYNLR